MPSSGVMKPKPFLASNHLTVPVSFAVVEALSEKRARGSVIIIEDVDVVVVDHDHEDGIDGVVVREAMLTERRAAVLAIRRNIVAY